MVVADREIPSDFAMNVLGPKTCCEQYYLQKMLFEYFEARQSLSNYPSQLPHSRVRSRTRDSFERLHRTTHTTTVSSEVPWSVEEMLDLTWIRLY